MFIIIDAMAELERSVIRASDGWSGLRPANTDEIWTGRLVVPRKSSTARRPSDCASEARASERSRSR